MSLINSKCWYANNCWHFYKTKFYNIDTWPPPLALADWMVAGVLQLNTPLVLGIGQIQGMPIPGKPKYGRPPH
jgi:hypothetical protein